MGARRAGIRQVSITSIYRLMVTCRYLPLWDMTGSTANTLSVPTAATLSIQATYQSIHSKPYINHCCPTFVLSSCCVVVRNVNRCLYFLPREKMLSKSGQPTDQDVKMEDLYTVSQSCDLLASFTGLGALN